MEKVIISDLKGLEKKKKRMIREGAGNLHVLSDFDRTLTYSTFNGEKTPSLIHQLRNGNYISKDYAKRAHALYEKYHPIECSNIPQEEKNKKMFEWWDAHFKLLVECGLDLKTIEKASKDIIEEGVIRLRKGVVEFLKVADKNKIPIIILTSSIGELASEFLKQQQLLLDNIYVTGNNLKFDDKGKFIGIDKIIHVFNKHESEIKTLPVYKKIENRGNVILLGDSLGDVGMAEGVEHENIIKIAFLDESEKGSLEKFKENFDVVLLGDPDFSFVNRLVEEILGK